MGKYPLALPPRTVLGGRYITGRVLGQGGFGVTYVAQDWKTKKLAAFNDNPNIVTVHSYFEENQTAYFVMDYVKGRSFLDYLKEKGKILVEEAERILLPVMDALAAVHSRGIVHRDVTPDNIFLTEDGSVKLLDFGAARYSLGDRSRSLDVVLKHGFAPKEQYTRRGRQGAFTDVYSLAEEDKFASIMKDRSEEETQSETSGKQYGEKKRDWKLNGGITVAIAILVVGILIGPSAWDSVMYCKDGYHFAKEENGFEIYKYVGEEEILTLPNTFRGRSVVSIGSKAFKESNIREVVIPEGIKLIDDYAFLGCQHLQKVEMADSVESMGCMAFGNCSKLTYIKFSNNIEVIGWSAFENCESLREIELPNNFKEIKLDAFKGCKNLKK